MNPISALISYSQNFTWKSFWILLALALLVGIILLGFELYTSHFEYSRADKQAVVLERLVSLRTEHDLNEQEEAIRVGILKSLDSETFFWSLPEFGIPNARWDKFVYGFIPWFLMCSAIFRDKNAKDKGVAVVGILFIGFIFGGLATLFPFDGFFMKFFVVPYGLVVFTILFLTFVAVMAFKNYSGDDNEHLEDDITNNNI